MQLLTMLIIFLVCDTESKATLPLVSRVSLLLWFHNTEKAIFIDRATGSLCEPISARVKANLIKPYVSLLRPKILISRKEFNNTGEERMSVETKGFLLYKCFVTAI